MCWGGGGSPITGMCHLGKKVLTSFVHLFLTWGTVFVVWDPSIAEGPSTPLGSEEVEVDVQGVEPLWAALVGLL